MTLSATAAGISSGATWAFWIFGVLTLLGAIGTITRRNPVTAALWLVLTLFATGGLFLVLNATFLAVIQVLVYAGAVMVLFVFVVMAVSDADAERFSIPRGWLSKLLGLAAVAVLADRLLRVLAASSFELPGRLAPTEVVSPTFGTVNEVGRLLFTTYLLPFEVLSVLLLVAVVAAVMITRRRNETAAEPAAEESGQKAAHRELHAYEGGS